MRRFFTAPAQWAVGAALLVWLAGQANAQTVVTYDANTVSPSSTAWPFTLSSATLQTYWTPTQLGVVGPGTITHFGIQFINAVNRTWPSVSITLAETTLSSVAQMSTTFAANYIPGTNVVVYNGPLTVITTAPDEHWQVQLQTPFSWTGTNNLLVEFRVQGLSTGTGTVSHRISFPTGNGCARAYNNSSSTSPTATGTQELAYGVRFTIQQGPLPVVSGVSPDPVDWLQTLTITGTDLDAATGVTIGGTAATIMSNTSTQIEVTVSDATPTGVQTVAVSTASGTDNSQSVTVNAIAPTIASATPDPVSWLATLTINGSALGNATSVTIGGTAATITSNTASQIQVTVPDGAPTGSQPVVVTTVAGTDSATVTVDTVAPTVTARSPNPVQWLGTLTLTGTALSTTSSVTVGGVAAAITSATSTQVQVTVDITTPTGSQTIAVTTAGGADSSQTVTVDGLAPIVSGVSPDPVQINGTLTITGNALANATSVTVGGISQTITSNTLTQITVTISASTPVGAGQSVVVTTGFGTDSTQTVEVALAGPGVGGGGGGCCTTGTYHDTRAAWLLVLFVFGVAIALRRRSGA